jgi:hypothetical protein
VIDQELSVTGPGVAWISRERDAVNLPPFVLVANHPGTRLMSTALQAGASTVLPRRDLTPKMLGEAVQHATVAPRRLAAQGDGDAGQGGTDGELVERILRESAGRGSAGYRLIRLIGQDALSRSTSPSASGTSARWC